VDSIAGILPVVDPNLAGPSLPRAAGIEHGVCPTAPVAEIGEVLDVEHDEAPELKAEPK